MNFEIFNNRKVICGVTDSSHGSFGSFKNLDVSKKLLKIINLQNITEKNLVFARQVHGDKVHRCLKGEHGQVKQNADALVTQNKNQILVIKTADCVPILLYEPRKKVVAAIHAGRKSLIKRIISKTINEMIKNYRISPKYLKAFIGPHIRKDDYDLKAKILKKLNKLSWNKYLSERNGKTYFDLTAAATDELENGGVLENNIRDCKICTFCDYKRYYSARRREANPAIYDHKFPCFVSYIGMI